MKRTRLLFRLTGGAFAILVAASLCTASKSVAQTPPAGVEERAELSGIVVPAPKTPSCAGPEGEPAIDYACLNKGLTSQAGPRPRSPDAMDDAASQGSTPSRVGTFSFSATQQRMGSNFGKAATPYRPPATPYANPMTAGRP